MLGRGGRTALLAAVIAAAMFVVPSVASAAVLCVGTSGGACTQAEPDLNTALGAAHNGDTIQLGAGTYTGTGSAYATTLTIKGVGVGGTTGTTITANSGNPVVLYLTGSGSAVSDLEVEIPTGCTCTGTVVNGAVSDVAVVAAEGAGVNYGVALMYSGASFSGTVDLAQGNTNGGGITIFHAPGTVNNATITGVNSSSISRAIVVADTTAVITDTRIEGAQFGIESVGASSTVQDSLITLDRGCPNCVALYATDDASQSSGQTSTLTATQDTLVAGTTSGGQPAGDPALEDPLTGSATAIDLDSTVGIGFPAAGGANGAGLTCDTTAGTSTMSIAYSSFDFDDTLSGADSLGDCTNYDLNHNENQGSVANTPVLPGVVNAAGGDYHPTSNSPLVDAGDPTLLSGGTDFDGHPRIVDGNGDGTAISDIGAFEYQRGAPTARIATPLPGTGTTATPITFNATASSDPNDGEALSYSWKFDDGATTTGATVTHTFATAGTHTATLTVSEPNGLTATATASVLITLPQPLITGLKLSHSHFARGKKPASIAKAKPPATTISFSLSEAAIVTFSFEREQPGRLKGTSCLAPTHARRHLRACTRAKAAGSFSFALPGGAARISFNGVLPPNTKLAADKYGLMLVAQASSGPPSAPAQTTFTLTH
jgi:PKD repeat protein